MGSVRWEEFFINIAERTALMSYATKRKVGCVAVINRSILDVGFNGTLAGAPSNDCEYFDEEGKLQTYDYVEHAERNLTSRCASRGTPLKGATLYVTAAPCVECAKSLVNAGFVKVVYLQDYGHREGIELLELHGVEVIKF